MTIGGWATPEGTDAYRRRLAGRVAADHFRRHQELWMSSIGIGTYLGHHDDRDDGRYRQAIVRALSLGCNVIDSAINYRCQRSERAVGAALAEAIRSGLVSRAEVVIATKGGFVPFDGAPPLNPPAYFDATFVRPGIMAPVDLVAGCHCMTPRYLADQLERSRGNLGLECIDIYYLHNPETQLDEVPREEVHARIKAAFAFLEACVAQGEIRMYGTATWNAYRTPPESPDHLSLAELARMAREVGGEGHHFRVIQLPFNLGMPEALVHANQPVDGETVSVLDAAERLGITVMASASIYQGNVARNLPAFVGECLPGLATDAQRAIQFVRSTPGLGVALVGMKQVAHVDENLKTAEVPPAPLEQYQRLFRQGG